MTQNLKPLKEEQTIYFIWDICIFKCSVNYVELAKGDLLPLVEFTLLKINFKMF